VALKVPRLHALASDSLRERFRREARATAALDHPHIVPIHEMGDAGPLHYIAFAYCEGPNLAQWLKLQAAAVPPRMAAQMVRGLAEAVHYSHQRGVLHRDLKPSNVLLFPLPAGAAGEPGVPFVPRIVDFGLARLAEEELEATGTTGVIGTPLYMAPEQALGSSEEQGPAADIYALGVVLYELLCGRPPFLGTRPLEVLDQVRGADPPPLRKQRPDVPRDLETICLKCLQKRPAERYATAQALADDLGRFLQGAEVAARPVTMWQRLVRWCQEPQRLREAGWTVVAVNIVMGGWTLFATVAVAAGWVPRPDHLSAAEVWRQLLPVVVFTSPVLVAIGVAIMQGKKWAAQIGAGSGAGMTVVALLLGLRLIENPYSWLYNDIPGYALQVYLLLAMLCFVQTLASVIAWMALSAREKRL
jgi:tRNA A-37 threonylcarbamoyl transferase component Bud32